MSSPHQEHADSSSEDKLIRLGCCYCERTDYDGVRKLPDDWTNIQPVTKEGHGIWESHLGVCPDCQRFVAIEIATDDDERLPWEDDEPAEKQPQSVHPIIRQIIDRDCHVATPSREVVRHVISKLKDGYKSYRAMPKADRRLLIEQCVSHHRDNFTEYVEVMSGFTQTRKQEVDLPGTLSGSEVVRLMRKHKKTIESLAFRLGSTMKRVRVARRDGLSDALLVRDWIQAITGTDPGPIPNAYRIATQQQSTDCGYCGCPLITGDTAFEYVGEVFCSTTCCRKSRGW